MCSDARIDTSGATDLSIRATRSSTFCHGAVPQDAADEGFIVGSGPIIIGHAAEFDAGSRAWAWEPYIESVLARRRQVPNDLAPVTTSVARRGFEPLTSSLKGKRPGPLGDRAGLQIKSIGPGSPPSGDDRGHDHLHQQVVCVV